MGQLSLILGFALTFAAPPSTPTESVQVAPVDPPTAGLAEPPTPEPAPVAEPAWQPPHARGAQRLIVVGRKPGS